MRLPIEWAERQFRGMGRRDAAELAVALIASYHGPGAWRRVTRLAESWLPSISEMTDSVPDQPGGARAQIAHRMGIALLTNTFRDPELMSREGRRLERWIDSLA
jgi:TetR/AcrR family transcriptional repressor of nem operon